MTHELPLGQSPAPARITEIDISGPARALAVLRWTDYTLVVACGLEALALVPDLISSAAHARWAELVGEALVAATMVYAAHTGWRHVGVIDPRVWRSYLRAFPALATVGLLVGLVPVFQWISTGTNVLDDINSWLEFGVGLWFVAVAIPGFVCVLLLRRMRVAPMGVRLDELLTGLAERGGAEAPRVTRVERPRFRRGVAYGAIGACLLLATTFVPLPMNRESASSILNMSRQINVLAFFLIVRARRYFQVSADALLAVDKRPPILFLRSFTDDERQQYGNSEKALLDFSLETRLANHFYHFGPFIAVGSPKDTVPEPGAARVLLADNEWQSRVLGWMSSSSLIVMYCGKTHWVNWELEKIIERGRSTNLILLVPEVKGWRASKRRKDVAERIAQLREAFHNTEWNEELTAFNDLLGLRAMLFRPDGSMVMVRSRSRSRDSYHLAALVAHQQLLAPAPAAELAAVRAAEPKRHLGRWVGAAAAGVAALVLAALVYFGGSDQPNRLAFEKGELFYAKPVTKAEAAHVGQFLLDQQYFSNRNRVAVRLDRNGARYQLQFAIPPSQADSLFLATLFGSVGHDVSRDILGGKPLEVLLSDSHWKPLKAVPPTAKLTFGAGELYYTDPVTAEQARAAGDLLHKIGYFRDDKGASVQLGREQNTYQLRLVVKRSSLDDPALAEGFRGLARRVAVAALGGQPVIMHLCDDEFHTLRSERIDGH